MNASEEIWRGIPGYEEFYEASSTGRIRRIKYTRTPRRPTHILKATTHSGTGYLQVGIWVGGVGLTKMVHSLVSSAFLGERPEGQVVRHLDANKHNNNISNLAYGTYEDNEADKRRVGRNANLLKTHCPRGHAYDALNTRIGKDGGRYCRACHRIKSRLGKSRRVSSDEALVTLLEAGGNASTT